MEIVGFTDYCEVWSYYGDRMFEGTREQCEEFIENYEDEDEDDNY